MSNKADFVKQEDAEFATQLENHHAALVTHGGALGFSGAEITVAENDAKYMRYIVTQHSQAQSFSQGYTRFKNLMRTSSDTATEPVFTIPATEPTTVLVGIETRFRERATKAKSSPAYNNDIGEQLKIVAPNIPFDPSTGKPTFKVFMDSGHPLLKWVKGGFQGVEIWADHGHCSGWVKQERENSSPWVDTTALPGRQWLYCSR
jgi:hypothetical protein